VINYRNLEGLGRLQYMVNVGFKQYVENRTMPYRNLQWHRAVVPAIAWLNYSKYTSCI